MSSQEHPAVLPDMRLSDDAIRRVLLSLIMVEQERLHKKGVIHRDHLIAPKLIGQDPEAADVIAVTEDALGFDSLALLDLILAVNRFFQLDASGVEDYLLIDREIGAWIALIQRHRDIVGGRWSFGFQTSGSAGTPKTVVHSAKVLWTEMAAQHQGPLGMLTPPGRVIILVPPHHIYGFLFGSILPEIAGTGLCDLHRAAPTAAFREARPGDLVAGTPYNWDMLGKTGKVFAKGVHGVTSAGPSTARTWDAVPRNGLSSLTEVFGSTETGGLASRVEHGADFTLLPHLSAAGGEVTCAVTGDPLPLQDKLVWTGRRRFRVAGRIDHVVQVAGVNVSPALVAEAINQIDGVSETTVRLADDRLKAFVVPVQPSAAPAELRQKIQTRLRKELPPVARPAWIDFGPALPRNAMGKLCDWTPQGDDAAADVTQTDAAQNQTAEARVN